MLNVATLTDVDDAWWNVTLALALATAGSQTLRRVWGTTLVAPAAWWILSALAIGVAEAMLAAGAIEPASLAESLIRYGAAVSLFCPLTAVLGAKRPQDRGWQWVVLSLWVVLLVPAGQALASSAGQRLELYGAWQALLAGFIAMGLLNYLPTRFWLSSLLAAAGQTFVLSDALFGADASGNRVAIGLGLLLAAAVTGALNAAAQRRQRSQQPATTARWLKFRDGWGAFWALRVMQRVNQTAELSHWPVRLEWSGFVPLDPADPASPVAFTPPIEVAIDQSLDNVLRRFE